jgi:hypothetical protein
VNQSKALIFLDFSLLFLLRMKEIIEFEKELNTLGESLPVSASKINHLTKIALDNVTVCDG